MNEIDDFYLSQVVLPPELEDLKELMAKTVHDTWAASRIAEGWKYGAERSDRFKTHPCLVPYEELPEIEKEYDRKTALNTLKLIRSCGFQIIKDKK